MTLAAGTRLGPYEVVAPVGAGGMGEVYRGTDTRLNRPVAIKIVSPEFAQRFEREAKTISQLTHPHICTLYDVGDNYLVMELLEGESLADRIAKGPLPMDQVFRYGIEIAEALDKAHRAGIVHRDLKPSNVMITKTGAKLLDFGLAKTVSGVFGPTDATQQKAITQEGQILGTFQYMAPEQLEGLEADPRTDIFAFGEVLYEMATGRRAFDGKTKTSLIAAIVDRDPPSISTVQPMTPPAFERVVKTCLAKDPDDRWQSARDVASELRWIQQSAPEVARAAAAHRVQWLPWAIAALAIIVAGAFAYLHHRAISEPMQTVRSAIQPPEKNTFLFRGPGGGFALSPDGRRIVVIALQDNKSMLWIRPLNALTAQPLLGTEGATFPFWSPDSRYIGFFAGGKLKKIDVSGGPAQILCDVGSQPRGGAWSKDGTILFSGNTREGLSRISSAGGNPSAATKLLKNEYSHRWPFFLPDGKHFLFASQAAAAAAERPNTLLIGSLDSDERHLLFPTSGPAMYAPPGYIVYPRDSTLFAQPFDARKLKAEGEAVPIAESVQLFPTTLLALFSVSDNGTLAFARSENITGLQLIATDRSGKQLEALTPPGDYNHPALSHDGKRLAYEQVDPGAGTDVWVLDLLRHVPTRLTFEPEDEGNAIWSPDDKEIAYSGPRPNGSFDLLRKASTGTSPPERLWGTTGVIFPSQWLPDGTILQSCLEPKQNSFDILSLSVQSRASTPLLHSKFDEAGAQVSPDGRLLAYASNVSSQMEIYIEPYPPSGAKWQVSNTGGVSPRWRHDGKELFYIANDGKIMTVAIQSSSQGPQISTPTALFPTHLRQAVGFQFDVSADGQKFFLNSATGGEDKTMITLVTNWTSELKR
jgi:eukaryotic-like serine/threonine-protein kinase